MNNVDSNEKIVFMDKEHMNCYYELLKKSKQADVYRKALFYCLGLSPVTRKHIDDIYVFDGGNINSECLQAAWQTSNSRKIIRMAFNLFSGNTPSVYKYENCEDKLQECKRYTAESLFCCMEGKFFYEAIKLRYPEYN